MKLLKEVIADVSFRLGKSRERLIQGFKMWINTREPSYVMRKTLRYYDKTDAHEPATTNLFKEIIHQGDNFVDIGANIGYFSLLAKSLGADLVYSFEPEEKNFDYLQKNLAINGFNDVRASSSAVSDNFGISKLYLCGYDSGHHTLNQNEGITEYRKTSLLRKMLDFFTKKRYKEIITTTLDYHLGFDKTKRVDVMKMDCEGSELLALNGMDKALRDNWDIKIVMEFFPLLLEKMGSKPEDLVKKILDYGFKIYIIPHDYDGGEELLKVDNYSELMKHCSGREEHINLLLKR